METFVIDVGVLSSPLPESSSLRTLANSVVAKLKIEPKAAAGSSFTMQHINKRLSDLHQMAGIDFNPKFDEEIRYLIELKRKIESGEKKLPS